jgi:hypothetical protein
VYVNINEDCWFKVYNGEKKGAGEERRIMKCSSKFKKTNHLHSLIIFFIDITVCNYNGHI